MRDSVLAGRRIVVTRAREEAGEFCQRLSVLGAVPLVFPTIAFLPLEAPGLEDALDHLERYSWIVFTSGNTVDFFFARVAQRGLAVKLPPVAVTGPATARAVAEHGGAVHFMPTEHTGAAVGRSLELPAGQRILLPRAQQGQPDIVAALAARGAVVDDIAIYTTGLGQPTAGELAALDAGVDILTFASPSSVRNFLTLTAGRTFPRALVACIGPTTAEATVALGIGVDVVARQYTVDGLIDALLNYFAESKYA